MIKKLKNVEMVFDTSNFDGVHFFTFGSLALELVAVVSSVAAASAIDWWSSEELQWNTERER